MKKMTHIVLIASIGVLGACASMTPSKPGPVNATRVADMNTFDIAESRDNWEPYFDHDAPGIPSQGVNWAIRWRSDASNLPPHTVSISYSTAYEPSVRRHILYFWKDAEWRRTSAATPTG